MSSVWAAGQTIIEDKYKAMAQCKKSLRLWNNAAVFFTCIFVATRLGFNAPSGEHQLEHREVYAVTLEMVAWLFFLLGLGWGQARREKDWLLRTAMLLGAVSIAAQVLALAPARIKEIIVAARAVSKGSGAKINLLGGLAQVGSTAARVAAVGTCATYITIKRAAAEQRRAPAPGAASPAATPLRMTPSNSRSPGRRR